MIGNNRACREFPFTIREAKVSSSFDEPNLVSAAGLIPTVGLAQKTGLGDLADERLTLKGYFGANAGLKLVALVAGTVAGVDSSDDMAILRWLRLWRPSCPPPGAGTCHLRVLFACGG